MANSSIGFREFVDLHERLLEKWQARRQPFEQFRELQRNRTVTVSSKTIYD